MISKTMFILDVIYYNCYLFYKALLTQVSPSIQPSLILGAIIGYPLAVLFNNLYIYIFCEVPSAWLFFLSGLSIMVLMFGIFEIKNRKEKVIKKKPRFFNDKSLNAIIMIFIVVFAVAFFYLGGPLGKYLLEQCGWSG